LRLCKHDGDDDEFIDVVRMSKTEWLKRLHSGETVDGKTVLALNWLIMENIW
jgi:hypothetical protein